MARDAVGARQDEDGGETGFNAFTNMRPSIDLAQVCIALVTKAIIAPSDNMRPLATTRPAR